MSVSPAALPEPERSMNQHAFLLTSLKLTWPRGDTFTCPPVLPLSATHNNRQTERTFQRCRRNMKDLLVLDPFDQLFIVRDLVVEFAHGQGNNGGATC